MIGDNLKRTLIKVLITEKNNNNWNEDKITRKTVFASQKVGISMAWRCLIDPVLSHIKISCKQKIFIAIPVTSFSYYPINFARVEGVK